MKSAIWSLALVVTLAGCKKKPDDSGSEAQAQKPTPTRASAEPKADWYVATRALYNEIPVTVRYRPASETLTREVWSYLEGIDDIFNSYRPDSEVGKLNQIAKHDGPVAVSGQMAEALTFSLEIFALTDGAFDITVAPLMRLWAQAVKNDRLPSKAAIKEALSSVGLDVVSVVEGKLVVAAPRRAFDFGGVIKGVAADRAAALLADAGATDVFIQVGNETVAYGDTPKGKRTTLAIDDPRDMDRIYETIVDQGKGLSATTSTNAHQPRKIAGKTYYHIVDPRTGMPVDTRTLSVTVAFAQAGKCGLADGLATAIAVLGPTRGIEIVEEAGGEALILTGGDSGELERHESRGWQALVRKRP